MGPHALAARTWRAAMRNRASDGVVFARTMCSRYRGGQGMPWQTSMSSLWVASIRQTEYAVAG